MRYLVELIVGLSLVAWSLQNYQNGVKDGRRLSDRYYEGVIAARVDEGIKGARRVMGILERSAYRRGKQSCEN